MSSLDTKGDDTAGDHDMGGAIIDVDDRCPDEPGPNDDGCPTEYVGYFTPPIGRVSGARARFSQ